MDKMALPYGDTEVVLDRAGAADVHTLCGQAPPDIEDLRSALYAGLETEMIEAEPLRAIVQNTDKVTIVISDLTRRWMRQDLLCGYLVDYLLGRGMPAENIAVLVALGTHRPLTAQELQKVSGEAYGRVEVLNHDSMAECTLLGTTSFGTQVRINPLLVHRKVILIGGTVHHLMSGFGGGRKSILPGVAAKNTIVQNHLQCLDGEKPRSSGRIGVGKLEDNPVHLDMMEAAAMVKPAFGINVIAGTSMPCRLVCGDWKESWLASCALVNQYFGVPLKEKADVVIASCGGYPKDINLYQATKSLLNAGLAVKKGGTLVLLARCEEGSGAPDFFDWIQPLRQNRLDAALRADFSIAGYIFYASIETIRQCGRVLLLTDIPAAQIQGMGMEVFASTSNLQAALNLQGENVYVMPNAGNTVPCFVSPMTP